MADRRSHPGDHHPLADLPLIDGSVSARFRDIARNGATSAITRPVPIEAPVSIEIDGIGYAVMMATPADLVDYATGFALAERLIERSEDIEDIEAVPAHRGILLRLTLASYARGRAAGRVRHRVSDSACGLCGIESLEQALRPLPRVSGSCDVTADAIFAAAARLADRQPLGNATRAVHAAALCGRDGGIRLVREDVGRHNAFDKLIGAMARGGLGWDGGFALLTSRLSYELVEKAALSGCPTIAAISAPTDLALERAAEAGIRVLALVRPDALLEAMPPPR